jgi:iron complex outermembrane receptor protein
MTTSRIVCPALFGVLAGGVALAADPPPLEEIVVTAGFRDVDSMTSPGSVSVVDATEINDLAAQHLETVLGMAPNVTYSAGASRARFVQIRGVGDLEQFVDPKHFPSVGITIDDVNMGGTANAAMLFDTRQVEVLRGPQGTAFGASALGGMVNIRGRRASDTFQAYVDAGAGSYGSWNVGGVVSGPLSKTLKGRVAMHVNRGDGYMHNAYLHRNDTNGYDESFVRGSLDIDPKASSHYALTALYFDGNNGYDAFSLDNTRVTLSDQPGRDRQKSVALSGRAEWDVAEHAELQAIAAWSDTHRTYAFDEDWTYVGICDGTLCDPVLDFFSNTDTYHRARDEGSLDLRLLGDWAAPGKLAGQYVVGVYAQHRNEDLHRLYYGDFFSDYRTDRRAVYGQVTADLTQALSLTAGLRYERFGDSYSDNLDFASSNDDDLHSGELTLSYQASEHTLLYATVSRGAKAGGVNTEASSSLPFMQPVFQDFMRNRLQFSKETLLNKEIGIKGDFLSGRVGFRAALFDMDRRNAQLESWMWDAVNYLWVGFLDNVDGSNRGLESELDFRVSGRLGLFAALGLLRTNVDRITTFDLDANDFVVRENIDQAKAPEWQYRVGADMALSSSIDLHVELRGSADSRFGYYHDQRLDGFHLLDASLGFRASGVDWRVWGRNLTNEDYAVHGLYFGNDPRKGWVNETYYQYGEPRVVGVSVRRSF